MDRFFPGGDPHTPDLSVPPMSLMSTTFGENTSPPQTDWDLDLGLGDVVRAFTTDRTHQKFIRQTFTALVTDPDTILWRQAVLWDFVHNPDLVTGVETLMPRLAGLREDNVMLGKRSRNVLLETSDRLSELDSYTELVDRLHGLLAASTLSSEALVTLRENLATLLASDDFSRLRAELPALRAPLQNIRSITVGINLDLNLQPISAALLSINDEEVGQQPSLLGRITGAVAEAGLLHQMPKDPDLRGYSELFQDMNRLLQQTAQPIARALKRYVKTSSRSLVALENEFAFFTASVRLMQRLEARGIPLSRPDVLPMDAGEAEIRGLRSMGLCVRDDASPVPSDVQFDDAGRLAILTGPNSGGKTTYLRSVGMAQVMFQAGLFVPAESARLSPVDQILTHFPALETRQQGRLAEEASRLRQIFAHMTPNSLVLLNETFSSTAFGEALFLAQDILAGLRAVGVRAIFATHLVELVAHLAEIEATVDGRSNLYSLVAGITLQDDGSAVPTHEITRGKPLGRSYAQDIARRHGISLAQILDARNDPVDDA